MGQINTTNYPTVSSLADADLLIVENAVHGTGTTTPKQLRENAIGTDVLKTTAQTVTGAINEIWETGGGALRGSGKAVSVTNNIIDTDIDLGRAPQVGDRILVLFDSSVTSVNAIKTYNGSTAVQTPWENVPVLDFHLNGVCIIEFIANPLSPDPTAICARLVRMFEGTVYTAGTGIGIDNGTITNTKPQMGVNIDGGTINSVSSGFLGGYTKAAKYLIITFDCDAVPYNGEYHLSLSQSGSVVIMYDAVLVDPVTGGRYSRNIKKYTTLICEVTNSGTGSSADPILVNVIGEITNDLADKVDAVLDAISEEKTATGNPITITDALPVPAKSLTATLNPIQDLHGYDHPWAGGAGKNQIDVSQTMYASTFHGITSQIVSETFKASGTVADGVGYYLGDTNKKQLLKAGTYTITIFPSGNWGTNTEIRLRKASDSSRITGVMTDATTKYATFTLSEDTYVFLAVVNSDATVGTTVNASLTVQIESGSSSTSYEPYSNICPISGRTETTVNNAGKNVIPLTVTSAKSNNTGGTWSGNVYTINGGKIEVLSDDGTTVKGLKLNGTFSAMSAFAIYFNYTAKAAMTLNGCPSGGGVSSYQLDINGGQNPDTGSGSTIAANTAVTNVRLRIGSGFTASGQIIKPMLSYEGGDYEPYRETVSVTIQFG